MTSKKETFVLTDPHQGNVSDDGAHVGLFDPGQYETLKKEEAILFVRMLAAFSNPAWHGTQRGELVDNLTAVCRLTDGTSEEPPLRTRIDSAYQATFSEPNATVGRKLHLLLLAASKLDVAIPNGYFGLAKMLHSLQAQENELSLPNVVAEVIESLYLDQLGATGTLYRWLRWKK
jgi:predicted unusual protein kinase regulating ubiquinone biosynthesis (AarF/ABC1/UbiB family)